MAINNMQNEIINAALDIECYSTFDKIALTNHSVKFPIAEFSALGAGFSSIAPMFRTITSTVATPASENLYRCIFPKGVTGRLVQFKDGTGNLGTILNNNGIVGQARWVKVENVPIKNSIKLPYNPTSLFICMALLNLNQKLDSIKKAQDTLVESIEQERKSQLLADLETLSEISEEYKMFWDNQSAITVSLNQVKNIQRNAKKELISYQEKILTSMDRNQPDSLGSGTSAKVEKIVNNFIHYKLAMYNQAYSAYITIMLSQNFKPEYLQKVISEIEEKSYQYRALYTQCYDFIKILMESSIESTVTKGIAKATKFVGNTVAKIPKLNQTQLDENLIASSKKIEEKEQLRIQKTIDVLRKHKESGIDVFAANTKIIHKLYNEPMELIFDKDYIYLPSETANS